MYVQLYLEDDEVFSSTQAPMTTWQELLGFAIRLTKRLDTG